MGKRYTNRTCTIIYLIYFNHHYLTIVIPPCSSRCNHNTSNRSKPKHRILRPGRRRRPSTIPTSFLIFWASRSIYSYPSGVWDNLTYCLSPRRKRRALWNTWNNLRHARNWDFRVHCMGPPHIYSRNRRRHPRLFHRCHYNHCRSNRY